jgi:hypothetical protein
MTSTGTQPTGWTGWAAFAGVMMIIGGSISAFQGLVAVINDEWVVWGNQANLYLDISQWGWVHLIIGLIVVAAGFGIFSGNVLARTVGVIIAAVSMVSNFLWLPAFPVWAIIIITVDALVIWALTAHGDEMRVV